MAIIELVQTHPQLPLLALVLAAVLFAAHRQLAQRRAAQHLPPGPPAHWLTGSPLPGPYAHLKWAEWTDLYGPVISVRTGSQITVIIGRVKEAVDIMEKEGASLADRPKNIAAGEVLSGGMRTLLVPAGTRFRKLRKALHARLSQKESVNYEPIQMENARNLVEDILKNPAGHQEHAKRYAAALVLTMAYGKTTPTHTSDPVVRQINLCLTRLGQVLLPGAWAVESYPWLRRVPGYLSVLQAWHGEELGLFREMVDNVRWDMRREQAGDAASEKSRNSFARYLLEHQTEFELSDDELAYVAGSMFGAGADTTAAAISITVLAAAKYPAAQAKVHEELELVLAGRAPTFADEDSLPQLKAFVMETFRWRPVSVAGVAHRATKDIAYGAYVIPAGASVVGNHWAIGHDPSVFPNPEHFDPQRWLTSEGALRADLRSYPFGFGRRICPGQHLADGSVYITTALTLWAFSIAEVAAAPIDVMAFTDTMNTHPLPFQVAFAPRQGSGGGSGSAEGAREGLVGYVPEGL
ncbi:cytochrome P450 [Athelia psychrophila]|uniref:Cytochrome P450 n=1 Tax=Athelia psychrophila TaxID=1759441 RepID=A0A166BZZ2_9AGAM|nr:cytochrome P450 [Fibularhizoctonia sp. CBS 109695]